MPTPHSEKGLKWGQNLDRRRIALWLLVLGGALVVAPSALWPPATASEATLQVEAVELAATSEPTLYADLPAGVQQSFDEALGSDGGVAVTEPVTLDAIRTHPYVSHEGTTYRLGMFYGERSTLGIALFGPLLIAIGSTMAVFGWLSDRRESLRPLTPARAFLVPGVTIVALWWSPATGGLMGLPPALGLLVPVGTMLVPVGVLCRQGGREYVLAGPAIGLTAGVLFALVLGANPARLDAVFVSIALVALPWFGLGVLLCEPEAADW